MTLVGAEMVGEAKTVSEPVLVISVNQPDSRAFSIHCPSQIVTNLLPVDNSTTRKLSEGIIQT